MHTPLPLLTLPPPTHNPPTGDWRVTLLGVKGLKPAAFDTVELTLEGKTSTFDLSAADSKKPAAGGEEVVRACGRAC